MRFLFLLISVLFAYQNIKPSKTIQFKDYISKIAYSKKYLTIGLESGEVIIQDFKTNKKLFSVKLPKIHDFMGDLIAMPIYSLDISPNQKEILILAEGEDAKRELFTLNIKTKKLIHLFTTKKTLMRANYITEDKIFFALLSDEVSLYDLKSKKYLYTFQVGSYVFSTYAINENKTLCAIGDESGSVKIVDILKGKKLKELKGYNKDKTLSLDFKKNLIINGSSDMRVAIYTLQGGIKTTLKTKFLPYATALSPKLDTFSLQYNEQNDIMVYDIYAKELYILKGHTMALNGIKYLNQNTIISYSPAEIIIWRLK
ncbi:MAG: nitrate reductase [Epsilonproteobacteria bacterium]|nr:nitrate reductase [Campylobacterota bacterium]